MNIKQIVKEMFSRIKQDWYLPVIKKQVYSEQEQVVGVWTDGKPLYRKTVVVNSPTNSIPTGINIDFLAFIDGCACTKSDKSTLPINWVHPHYANQYGVSLVYIATDNTFQFRCAGYTPEDIILYVTLEYTKTTDTPTTSKVPFEPLIEYSTDEKMIGYWVDGKPLYRKTIRLDNVPVNSETAIDHNIQNVDLIWFKKDASWMYDTSEQGTWALGAGNSNVSYHFFDVWANRTKYSIDLRGFTEGRASYAYITFEYTKTTD